MNDSVTASVAALLAHGDAAAPAILAPDLPALTHGGLRDQIAATVERLNALGIGRGDRVAMVLPNGPEMAAAFLAVAAGATTAPLNPAYRAEEFEFYLTDLKAKALIVQTGLDTPAIAVAKRLGVPLLGLTPEPARGAGAFMLEGGPVGGTAPARGMADAADVALVLHTSGTTSRPKIVPLSHANICASARHIGRAVALSPADRCLNIMPLFHIHGLMAAVLSSVAAGASVVCTPGFNALKVFGWIAETRPSWYTAVPTMHQAILARAERNAEVVAQAGLRLIRSSSSSLPPQVMTALEGVFKAPVIESYGMTEAAHQMTSNPLPPRARFPGSVGVAAGPEVTILDEAGAQQPPGTIGEVSIRGPNVTAGYESNPDANAKAFTHGWFRTGDQGVIDAEGKRGVVAEAGLRLIRSSSSSLPPQVMTALEGVFKAPVIESYGMTEAAHQMTSNPLPPRARFPGSVGVAAGPEVTILDEAGAQQPPGNIGEVSIRGPNVTAGYESNPEANAKAFTHGWFRTGDQGVIDAEGYLRLTGRLKELINRGGEKISPLEVDEILMDHPAVQQVVTFAMPHDKLGEDVAAAIVLREGQSASEREIRDFVAGRLADFKVPRKVIFLPEIPKGATGKLQRIGLAEKLGLGK